jgi:hypothetical protein
MQAMLLKFLAVAVILGAGCATALADLSIEAIGDIQETGSWQQQFRIVDSRQFNLLDIRLTSNDAFESPAIKGLNNQWDNVHFVATEATASGKATNSENFTILIAGAKPSSDNPVSFDVLVFPVVDDNTADVVHVSYSKDPGNRQWLYTTEVISVPAPAAVVLGMLGLGLVGWLKRRVA